MGWQNNFGHGSILCSFFFERIPGVHPRKFVPPPHWRVPKIKRWTYLLYLLQNTTTEYLDKDFFIWWSQQKVSINDHAYSGVEFCEDPDLALLPGARWGEMGMTSLILFFYLYMFFFCILLKCVCVCVLWWFLSINFLVFCEHVGAVRPTRFLIHQCFPLEDANAIHGDSESKCDLHAIEWNMTQLTLGIPMAKIEDVPRHLQCHVINVPCPLVHLFCQVLTCNMCYQEVHRETPDLC